jgi:hypothetical protein
VIAVVTEPHVISSHISFAFALFLGHLPTPTFHHELITIAFT